MSKLRQVFARAYAEVASNEAAASEICVNGATSSLETAIVSTATAQAAADAVGRFLDDNEEAELRRFQATFGLTSKGAAAIEAALQKPRATKANIDAHCESLRRGTRAVAREAAGLIEHGARTGSEQATGFGLVLGLLGGVAMVTPCDKD